MRKIWISCILAVVLQSSAFAQEPPEIINGVDRDLLYNRATVHLRDGTSADGLLAGLYGDSLCLLLKGIETRYPLSSVWKIEVETSRGPSSPTLLGAFVGMYLGTAVLGKLEGDPFGNLDGGDTDFFPYTLACALPGMYVGHMVAGGAHRGTESFTIEGTEEEVSASIAEVRCFLIGGMPERRVHVTVEGGWFSRRVSTDLWSAHSVPYSPYKGYTYWGERIDGRAMVNLLRKIQVTYSFKRWLEAGLAIIRFSESDARGYGAQTQTDSSFSYPEYLDGLRAVAYTVVGSIEPLRASLPNLLRWKVGGGLGLARVEMRSSKTVHRYSAWREPYNPSHIYWRQEMDAVTLQSFSKSGLALTFFSAFEVRLTTMVTLGLAVDYTFCPGIRYHAIPEWGLDARPVGNLNAGFTFGAHF